MSKKYSKLEQHAIEYGRYVLNVYTKQFARKCIKEIEEFISFFPTLLSPDDIYLSERNTYYKHLLTKRGCAPAYANWIVDMLRTFWNWMKDRGYATFNPFRGVDPMY